MDATTNEEVFRKDYVVNGTNPDAAAKLNEKREDDDEVETVSWYRVFEVNPVAYRSVVYLLYIYIYIIGRCICFFFVLYPLID